MPDPESTALARRNSDPVSGTAGEPKVGQAPWEKQGVGVAASSEGPLVVWLGAQPPCVPGCNGA